MIEVTDIKGMKHALHPDAIARVIEAGTSSQWHGINCYIKTFDGETIEGRESISQVLQQIAAAGANR